MRPLVSCEGMGTDDIERTIRDIFTGCGICLANPEIRGRRDHLAIRAGRELFQEIVWHRYDDGELMTMGDEKRLFGFDFQPDDYMQPMAWVVKETVP